MAAPDEHLESLTRREREVLDLVRRGLTNDEIAQQLGITLDGAKYHVSQILSKLGVASREEAAALVEPRGWPWRRLVGVAVVAAALAGIAVLAWSVLANEEDGSSDPFLRVSRSPGDPTGNPSSLTDAFCIQAVGVDSSYEGRMKEVIDATIAELYFWRDRYAETVIDFGCPYPPIDYTKHPRGRVVDAEGYYDAYIYILPPDTIERYFIISEIEFGSNVIGKSGRVHLTAEEETCAGDSCAQVSYGLYLTPDDVSERGLYIDQLCWAIGAGMPYPTDWPPNPCNNYRGSPAPTFPPLDH